MRVIWVTITWLSVLGLIMGTSLLLFGYLSAPMTTSTLSTAEFNYYLECSRVFGLVLFSAAGIVLALCLLLPSFVCPAQCFDSHASNLSNLLDDCDIDDERSLHVYETNLHNVIYNSNL